MRAEGNVAMHGDDALCLWQIIFVFNGGCNLYGMTLVQVDIGHVYCCCVLDDFVIEYCEYSIMSSGKSLTPIGCSRLVCSIGHHALADTMLTVPYHTLCCAGARYQCSTGVTHLYLTLPRCQLSGPIW